jgi:hypothetical protein
MLNRPSTSPVRIFAFVNVSQVEEKDVAFQVDLDHLCKRCTYGTYTNGIVNY